MTTDIHTLAGAYALDAVDDIERAAFARHLAACESCAQEIAELRETVARLSSDTVEVPPPSLKPAVLTAITRTRQLPPGHATEPASGGRNRWRTWTASAAAAIVLVAGGLAGGYAIERHRSAPDRAAAAAAEAQTKRINAVLAAPDAKLVAQTLPAGGTVTVVVSDRLNQGVAILNDMPELPAGKTYQLWVMHGTNATSVGVMADGSRAGYVPFGDVRGPATQFGVTQEISGGSTTPHTPVVVALPI